MSPLTRLSITLPADQAEAVEAAVAAGEFASASDVVSSALDSWLLERSTNALEVEQLRRLWNEGKASGDAKSFSFDDVRRRARRALMASR